MINKQFEIALEEYGTLGIVGDLDNARVIEYFAKSGNAWVKDDETAWCAAFVGFCLETAGVKSTKKLNARSYLTWGAETKTPKIGDVVVFWRIAKDGPYGHVAFFVKQIGDYIYTLGGNQSNSVCISKYPVSTVLGYRTV